MTTESTYLHIVRHGQTEWNIQGRMQGQQDSPLSPKGIQQVQQLSEKLREIKFASIYSSSSGRAIRTAETLRGSHQIPLIPKDDLQEIHLGKLEGLSKKEAEILYPDHYPLFWKAPEQYQPPNGGETFQQVVDRVIPCIKDIVENHIGEHILIVTHTVVVKIAFAYFEQRPLSKI